MLAYLFERFPTFTQTFCHREVQGLLRQKMPLEIYSIRRPVDEPPQDYDPEILKSVVYLPEEPVVRAEVNAAKDRRELPKTAVRLLRRAQAGDKQRIYQAAWLGERLKQEGIIHVHTHFAGLAARTAFWLHQIYGITYSFTGHANDIFCRDDHSVSLPELVKTAAFVVTVSDFTARQLKEAHPAAAKQVFRVYNGIDLERFQPSTGKRALILSVGRYIEKKGFPDLILACAILRDCGYQFECQIIGEGPMADQLQNQIVELGLQNRVSLEGPKTQAAIVHLLREARLFVLPCVVERDGGMDNLPTVIVEAMAASLPVVSTRLAGVPEMVEDGKTGLLVEPGEVANLAAAMEKFMESPELARSMGKSGAERARRIFGVETTTRQLKHLFVEFGGIEPGEDARALDPEIPAPRVRRGWLARLGF